VYGLTTVDGRGRVADLVVARALAWRPGNRLNVRVTGNVIILAAADAGQIAVSSQGRVHLPAAVRHACGIAAGDRVLLAAEPADGVLVVHPLATLDAMITLLHDRVMAGDAA
jgi:AbrB family looped-hinge helix DNA binding protein